MRSAPVNVFTPPWWWDSASNLIGVLLGAIVGAAVAYVVAKQSARETLLRDQASQNEKKKSAIFVMSVELVGIIDILADLRSFLSDQLSKRSRKGWEQAEPWQLVMPRVGHTASDVPRPDQHALALLFEDGELELMQQLILLSRRCLASHTAFLAYCERREKLSERMPPPVAFEGNVGRTELTREQALSLMRFTLPLNDLIVSLQGQLEEDWALAMDVADKFTLVARRHLGRPNFEITTLERIAAEKNGSKRDAATTEQAIPADTSAESAPKK